MMSGDGLRLSVVIPSFNTAALTMRCLATVQAAAPERTEIIVVDDGSRDGSLERLERLGDRITVIPHLQQLGFTAAANHGLSQATGDVLLLLNSDTEVARGALDLLLAAFAADPGLGIGGAELRFPDGRPQWSGGRQPSMLWMFMLTSGLPALLGRLPGYRLLRPVGGGAGQHVEWVPGAAMAIRREAWNELAPLDDRYVFYCQDLDLCVRAGEAGWKVGVVPGFRVIHHLGASIGRQTGSSGESGVPELLWADLLRWAEKAHGTAWAERGARVMRAGAGLRLAARRLRGGLLRADRRAGWQRQSAAFRAGLRALMAGEAGASGVCTRSSGGKGNG